MTSSARIWKRQTSPTAIADHGAVASTSPVPSAAGHANVTPSRVAKAPRLVFSSAYQGNCGQWMPSFQTWIGVASQSSSAALCDSGGCWMKAWTSA